MNNPEPGPEATSDPSLTPRVDLKAIDGLFDLEGARVFLPGGYGALGEAIAWGFARHGARVAIAGPNAEKAERLAQSINENTKAWRRQPGYAGQAIGLGLNARDTAGIAEVADRVADSFGGLDILVNCVGIQKEQALLDVTPDVFDEMYETNLRSAMFLSQAAARHQIAGGAGGRQIHLLSVRSQLALRHRGYSAYCATKGAMVMLVKQHAMELAEHNITVNGIAPTFIQSERIRPHLERQVFHDFIVARNPLGRIGNPVEVVGQVLALAAPAGSYITGQIVYIDGGVTASQ